MVRTEVSHVVKSGYSAKKCDLDGSEPCGLHIGEENVGGVLWDAIVRGEQSPCLGFRLKRLQRVWVWRVRVCAEAANSIMAVSLQQSSPGLLAGVPWHPGAGSVSEPLGCG